VSALQAMALYVIFRKRALELVALLRKMTCNLRHRMDLRHRVSIVTFLSYLLSLFFLIDRHSSFLFISFLLIFTLFLPIYCHFSFLLIVTLLSYLLLLFFLIDLHSLFSYLLSLFSLLIFTPFSSFIVNFLSY